MGGGPGQPDLDLGGGTRPRDVYLLPSAGTEPDEGKDHGGTALLLCETEGRGCGTALERNPYSAAVRGGK